MTELDPIYTALLRRHVYAETRFDMEATLATLTEDCLFEDVPLGEVHRGREGARCHYREWWDAFGQVPTNSRLHVSASDRLVVETRFVGTHRGVYRGLEATGHPIDLPVVIFVEFRDGLMACERFYYDRMTLLAQLSGQPGSGAAAPPAR